MLLEEVYAGLNKKSVPPDSADVAVALAEKVSAGFAALVNLEELA